MAKPVFYAVILALVVFSGCIFGGGHDIEARVRTEGKKIAVIPFRRQDEELYFLESKVGDKISVVVAQLIMKEAINTKVADPTPAFDMVRDKNPEKIKWGEVAKKLEADYVIVGNILTYRARDPKRHVNCYRGEMAVQVTVWDQDNAMVLMETATAEYPSGKYSAPVVDIFSTTEEEVLARLRAKTALRIARFFFDHTPSKE